MLIIQKTVNRHTEYVSEIYKKYFKGTVSRDLLVKVLYFKHSVSTKPQPIFRWWHFDFFRNLRLKVDYGNAWVSTKLVVNLSPVSLTNKNDANGIFWGLGDTDKSTTSWRQKSHDTLHSKIRSAVNIISLHIVLYRVRINKNASAFYSQVQFINSQQLAPQKWQ